MNRVYVICFTVCFSLYLFSTMPVEKIQAIGSITHHMVELNTGTKDEDAF